MIQFGNDKIKEIYHGSDKIKEVYHGGELVWRETEVIPGYWVHKDTGVVTYFGLDADFITNGIMSQPSWANDCSEVNIPVGVTSLGDMCFFNCESLTSITLPEGVVSLGASCFEGCTSLTSITLPESVTSLGMGCFYGCSALILITVLPAIPPSREPYTFDGVHTSFNIKVRSPYVNDYKTDPNWWTFANKISAI